MTTYLYSLLSTNTEVLSEPALESMTAGAAKMAETDPTGLILTMISVFVVFSALIVLYFIYSFSGGIFSGKFKRKAKVSSADAEVATAIALALEMETADCTPAAIAAALHLHFASATHDIEPGIITIRRSSSSAWSDPQRNFRKNI